MSTESTTIPVETARHILWHWGQPGGYQPGTFTQSLMTTIERADRINAEKLRIIYPDYVAVLKDGDLDTVTRLQAIASGGALRCTRCRDEDGPFTTVDTDTLCEACARPMPLDGVA